MSAGDEAPREMGLLRAWWILDRGSLIQTVGLGLSMVSFVLLWPSLLEADWAGPGGAGPVLGNLFLHAYVLGWLLLVTIAVRSIGCREVMIAFFMGVFLVPSFVFVAGWPARQALLSSNPEAIAVYWAPVLEETGLLLALGILTWRLLRRAGRAPGILDLYVLGFAVGSGFAVHEDALYGRLLAGFPTQTVSDAFSGAYGPLFPTFVDTGQTVAGANIGFYTYHAGHGAFFGLVIGIIVLLYRRYWWVVFLLPAAWLYAVVEHGVSNAQLSRGPLALRHLFAGGHLIAVLLVLVVPTLLVIAYLRRARTPIEPPAIGLFGLRDIAKHADGIGDTLVRWIAFARYHRTRNAAINAAWRRPDVPVSGWGIDGWGRLAFGRGLFDPKPATIDPPPSSGVARPSSDASPPSEAPPQV